MAVIPKPRLRNPAFSRFTDYFSHPFDAIVNQSCKGWATIKHPLDDGQIWKSWQDGDRLIGLGFGKVTRYALIDIDADSIYHTEDGLRDIRWALESIGIHDTVLIQSSYSQGWHLYFGFSRPVPTFGLSCLLHQAMEVAGLAVAKGILELFPNRKGWQKGAVSVYNRHRLPLQPAAGSALLNDDLAPYSTDLGTFLDRLDETAIANDIDLIEELAAEARSNYNPSKRKVTVTGSPFTPHNPNARQWKKNLEEAIATGWTDHHQSNILLGQIAEYGRVFLGYDDEHELADYIAKTAIAAPGFIPHCRHRKEIKEWSLRWARSAMKHRYPYGTRRGGEFKQLGKGGLTNDERKADAMARIADTVADFQESGRAWPKTIHARRKLIAMLARCSQRTLVKPDYLPLWHPNHIQDDDLHGDTANGSNPCPEKDTATQDNIGSYACNNCGVLFPSENLFNPQGVLPNVSILTKQVPQTLTGKGTQSFSVIQYVLPLFGADNQPDPMEPKAPP
jgi:hypothetical protein